MAADKHNKVLNVPTLRFPEFSGEWHCTTIGDCCSPLEYGMNAPAKEYDGMNKYIRITDIDEGTYTYKYDDVVSPNAQLENKYKVQKNDILFARTGASTGKAYLYNEKDGLMYYAGFLIRGNVKPAYNAKFVSLQTQTQKYKKWVDIMSIRSGQPGINSQEYSGFKFHLPPSKVEQDKISTLFTLLDERITTQIRIINEIQSLISGITQKISKHSSIRMTMLSELLEERNEKNTALFPVHSVSVSEGVINQIDYLGRSFAAADTSHYNVAHKGDIIYTKSPTGEFPFGIVKRNAIESNVAVSPLYGVYKPISDDVAIYLHYYFCSPLNAQNYLHKLIQKGAKNTINITNQRFVQNCIPLPDKKTLEGFVKLTTTVSTKLKLEKSLLEKLQKQKRYLLTQMFV